MTPRGGGLVGGGVTPYKPFENDKVEWLDPSSETAAPAVSKQGGSKPSVFLFVGSGDAEHCCARTFERAVFRDKDVVDYTKDKFLAIRLDRTGAVAKAFDVNRPEIVILDAEGDEVARFIECTEPNVVLEVMKECDKRAAETKSRTGEWGPRLVRAEGQIDEGKVRDASATIAKALKVEHLSRLLREKVARLAKSLDDKAQEKIQQAKGTETDDPVGAWRLYREVRDDYWGLPASKAAKAAITALEKNPANKDRLEAARKDEAAGKKSAPAEPKAAPPSSDPPSMDPPAEPPQRDRDPETDD